MVASAHPRRLRSSRPRSSKPAAARAHTQKRGHRNARRPPAPIPKTRKVSAEPATDPKPNTPKAPAKTPTPKPAPTTKPAAARASSAACATGAPAETENAEKLAAKTADAGAPEAVQVAHAPAAKASTAHARKSKDSVAVRDANRLKDAGTTRGAARPVSAHAGGSRVTDLAARAGHAFEPLVMVHGLGCHARGVEVVAATKTEVRARVRSKRTHDVFLRADAGRLLVACTCPAPDIGEKACKHAWATLLEIDRRGGLEDLRTSTTRLHVVPMPFGTPELVEAGPPKNAVRARTRPRPGLGGSLAE
jgi:hypothetical protein